MSLYASSLGSSEVFFGTNASDRPVINFFDPAYVRSETIVFQRDTGEVHAVLHENLHYLGKIPAELGASFIRNGQVLLSATNYNGEPVAITAHVSVA